MGRCCVPGCCGNYDNGPKVRVYSFPSDDTQKKSVALTNPTEGFHANSAFEGKELYNIALLGVRTFLRS